MMLEGAKELNHYQHQCRRRVPEMPRHTEVQKSNQGDSQRVERRRLPGVMGWTPLEGTFPVPGCPWVKAKGRGDKVVAVAIMEKQLYREKTLLKRMFSPQRVNELDHKATISGIAKNE